MQRERSGAGWRAAAAVVALLAVVAIGCGSSGSGSGGDTAPPPGQQMSAPAVTLPNDPAAVKTGGKLIYGIEAETDSFDPTKGRWAISATLIGNAIYDEMYAYDKDGVPRPYAVESGTPNADFTTWTMRLRPGMTYHDGTPVNTTAVKKQVDAFKNSTLTGPALLLVKNTEIVDDLTMKVNMTAPWAAFPNVLTGQGGVLVAPKTFDDPNGGKNPVGSGPFKFKEWKTDDHFSVTRNENYWMKDAQNRQLPYLDEVVFKPIPDTQAREKAFEAHDINMLHEDHPVQLAQLKDLADSGRAQYVPDTGETEETFVMLNNLQPPLDDPLLRQALAYATNVEEYIDITQNTKDAAADGAFEKKSKWYFDAHFPQNDPVKAADLIKQYQAKHGNGPITIKLATTTTPENAQIVQDLQQQWQKIGVTVQAETLEQIQLITAAVTGKYDALLFRQFGAPDPDSEWHFWTPKNSPDIPKFGLNFSRLRDAEVEKQLDVARGTDDFAKRKAAYDIVQQRWAELVPYVWLDHVHWVVAADNSIRGIGNNALPDGTAPQLFYTGSHRLTATWIDPSSS